MSYVVLECPKCHAGLEIDREKIIAYCPYCGTKLSFDADQMTSLLREKEKTKRVDIRSTADVKKVEVESNAKAKEKISENVALIFFCLVMLGVMAMFLILYLNVSSK